MTENSNIAIMKRTPERNDINCMIQTNAQKLIEQENSRYIRNVRSVANFLASKERAHKIVMLSGPSSAGKTTTASLLKAELLKHGIDGHVVSMDDFYRGREQAPKLGNGAFDYEALEALRLDKLEQCITEIINDGKTMLPRYNFTHGRPDEHDVAFEVSDNSVVILEGIHAINPYFEYHIPAQNMFKLFVNTVTPFYHKGEKIVKRRDIRLVRRMLRDWQYRSSSFEETIDMWPQVSRGENKYMFPYVDTVDVLIDTTHTYEPCLFAKQLLPMLQEEVKRGGEEKYRVVFRRLIQYLNQFSELEKDILPENSLLREFVGGGIYS